MAGVLALGFATPAAATDSVAPSGRVILYGDSLAWESEGPFRDAVLAAGVRDVLTRTFGGTAICDFLDDMAADAAQLRPDVVVVEFSGNAITPCMLDASGAPLTGAAYLQRYAADARAVVDIFGPGGTVVYFASAPPPRDRPPNKLRAIYGALGWSSPLARFVDAGAAVTDRGRWTATMPCLPIEPCDGSLAIVRAPDGVHFCPGSPAAVAGRTERCSVWASGAYRYGTAMAAPVVATWRRLG